MSDDIKGKHILLTGLTGRLGSVVARSLARDNIVYGLARYSQSGTRERWEAEGVRTIVADLAADALPALPEVDYVLHLAAWTGDGFEERTTDYAIRQNAEATGLLMAATRGAKAFLHMSTMGVYHPEPPPSGFRETDPVGPGPGYLNYTASKFLSEGVARSLCRIFDMPTIIVRITCQYGSEEIGGVPKMFALDPLLRGESILVAAGADKLRSPIHNDDVIRFLGPLLAAASTPATIVNCGGDEPASVEMMARHLGELLGIEPRFEVRDPYPFPYGHLDPTRRIEITGPCAIPWREGLQRMVEGRLRREIS